MTIKERIEEILENSNLTKKEYDRLSIELASLFHTEAESLIGEDEEFNYSEYDEERQARNSLRAEQRNKLKSI